MKFIYMLVLFSSMLFGMQKQIILGSYSVEKNGLNAVITVLEQIKNDEALQRVMGENSAQVMPTTISGYTVVSMNIFESYTALLPAMKVLKTYYSDAFVLNYPTQGFLQRETLKEVQKKADEEAAAIASMAQEVVAEAVLEEKQMEEEVAHTSVSEPLEEEKLVEEELVVIEEVQEIEEVIEPIAPVENIITNTQADKKRIGIEKYYLVGGLALLVLLIGGFIIYKQTTKEDD